MASSDGAEREKELPNAAQPRPRPRASTLAVRSTNCARLVDPPSVIPTAFARIAALASCPRPRSVLPRAPNIPPAYSYRIAAVHASRAPRRRCIRRRRGVPPARCDLDDSPLPDAARAARASNGSRSGTYLPIFVDVFSLVATFRLVVKSRRSTTRRVVKKREGTLHFKFKA